MHPSWGARQVTPDFPLFLGRKGFAQTLLNGLVDMIGAQFAQSLEDQTTDLSGQLHAARAGAPQLDLVGADHGLAAGAVGQEHDLHGYLLAQPQLVGSVGACRLQTDTFPPGQSPSHAIQVRAQRTQNRIDPGVFVEASTDAVQFIGLHQPGESVVDIAAVSDVGKGFWGSDITPTLAIESA